jgi:hypothetical protein
VLRVLRRWHASSKHHTHRKHSGDYQMPSSHGVVLTARLRRLMTPTRVAM